MMTVLARWRIGVGMRWSTLGRWPDGQYRVMRRVERYELSSALMVECTTRRGRMAAKFEDVSRVSVIVMCGRRWV